MGALIVSGDHQAFASGCLAVASSCLLVGNGCWAVASFCIIFPGWRHNHGKSKLRCPGCPIAWTVRTKRPRVEVARQIKACRSGRGPPMRLVSHALVAISGNCAPEAYAVSIQAPSYLCTTSSEVKIYSGSRENKPLGRRSGTPQHMIRA